MYRERKASKRRRKKERKERRRRKRAGGTVADVAPARYDPHGGGSLPPGWEAVASRSNPGTTVYRNLYTREKVAWPPKWPASEVRGASQDIVRRHDKKAKREAKKRLKAAAAANASGTPPEHAMVRGGGSSRRKAAGSRHKAAGTGSSRRKLASSRRKSREGSIRRNLSSRVKRDGSRRKVSSMTTPSGRVLKPGKSFTASMPRRAESHADLFAGGAAHQQHRSKSSRALHRAASDKNGRGSFGISGALRPCATIENFDALSPLQKFKAAAHVVGARAKTMHALALSPKVQARLSARAAQREALVRRLSGASSVSSHALVRGPSSARVEQTIAAVEGSAAAAAVAAAAAGGGGGGGGTQGGKRKRRRKHPGKRRSHHPHGRSKMRSKLRSKRHGSHRPHRSRRNHGAKRKHKKHKLQATIAEEVDDAGHDDGEEEDGGGLSLFCEECGAKYKSERAKFCNRCGHPR